MLARLPEEGSGFEGFMGPRWGRGAKTNGKLWIARLFPGPREFLNNVGFCDPPHWHKILPFQVLPQAIPSMTIEILRAFEGLYAINTVHGIACQ